MSLLRLHLPPNWPDADPDAALPWCSLGARGEPLASGSAVPADLPRADACELVIPAELVLLTGDVTAVKTRPGFQLERDVGTIGVEIHLHPALREAGVQIAALAREAPEPRLGALVGGVSERGAGVEAEVRAIRLGGALAREADIDPAKGDRLSRGDPVGRDPVAVGRLRERVLHADPVEAERRQGLLDLLGCTLVQAFDPPLGQLLGLTLAIDREEGLDVRCLVPVHTLQLHLDRSVRARRGEQRGGQSGGKAMAQAARGRRRGGTQGHRAGRGPGRMARALCRRRPGAETRMAERARFRVL